MNKSELISRVGRQTVLPQRDVQAVLDALTATILQTIAAGEEVKVVGFGTFKTVTRKEREGRNPKTGEAITIPARTVARWIPGKAAKDAVDS